MQNIYEQLLPCWTGRKGHTKSEINDDVVILKLRGKVAICVREICDWGTLRRWVNINIVSQEETQRLKLELVEQRGADKKCTESKPCTHPLRRIDSLRASAHLRRNALVEACPEPDADELGRALDRVPATAIGVEGWPEGGRVRRVDRAAVIPVRQRGVRAAVV